MPKFRACFRLGHEADADWDTKSSRSSRDSADMGHGELEHASSKKQSIMLNLFPARKPLTRAATKMKLKKIITSLQREALGKASERSKKNALVDQEFKILMKVYADSDASAELCQVARSHPEALSHLTPFLLNALLYGFKNPDDSSSNRSSIKSSMLQIMLPAPTTPPAPLELNSTEVLVKHAPELQLEQWVFQEAYRSIHFALECAWYFTSSLQLGPVRAYHRTMSLLLGIQSAMSSAAPPPEMLQKNLESDVDALRSWLAVREERRKTFEGEINFIKCLTDISYCLYDIPPASRRDVLRAELDKLNQHIPENVFLPTVTRPHRVLRVVPEEAHVFSTRERSPYLLLVEIEDFGPQEDRSSKFTTQRSSAFSDFGPPSTRIQAGDGCGDGLAEGLAEASNTIGPAGSPPASPMLGLRRVPSGGTSPLLPQSEQIPHVDPISKGSMNFSQDVLQRGESSVLDPTAESDRRPPDLELIKALGEPFAKKTDRLRSSSPFGSRRTWRLASVIVKARDQLRQEMFAQRLIQEFGRIWERAKLDLWVRPYNIIATSWDSGFMETVTDAKTIDSLKKNTPGVVVLQDFFIGKFGGKGSSAYKRAVKNFVKSMAGYSIVSYLLNIKDRHNGNLLIDSEGHIIHIDFGFLLSNSPGGNIEFEKAPFKLTREMVQVMGGRKSGAWKLFRKLCIQGYVEACRHANKILLMVDIAYPGNERMPCFLQGRDFVLANLRERFGVDLSRKERALRMSRLIGHARGNLTTKLYDQFQRLSLGIAT